MRSEPILVTFTPSTGSQDQEVSLPLVNDQINEDYEGFFVIVLSENISDPSIPVELVRDGVTLVRIEDDDRKCELSHLMIAHQCLDSAANVVYFHCSDSTWL